MHSHAGRTAISNPDRERGKEGRERGKGRKGKRRAIAIGLLVAWKGISMFYFITFPVKYTTKNFRICFLRMIWN